MKRIIMLLLIISICLPIAGCWNSRELTDMSIVVGMGVDAVPNSDQYSVSFQIVNAGALSTQGVSQAGTGALPVVTYSSQDKSLFGALRKASRKVPRRLFFGHIQLVVIGEAAARKGIEDMFDFFERSHEVRLSSVVLIARGITAQKVMSIITPLEKTPSIGISRRSRITSEVWAENAATNAKEIINDLVGPGEPIIGGIQMIGDRAEATTDKNSKDVNPPAYILVNGIALMKKGKLTGWLDNQPARGVMWTRNKMKGTAMNLLCGDTKDNDVVIVVRSKTKVKPSINNGKPKFLIHVKEEGILGETSCSSDLDSRKSMLQIQDKWTAQTKEEISAAIKAAQKAESDVVGFGSTIERTHPEEWKKLSKDWPKIFAQSEYEVQVEAYIRRAGMRGTSFKKQMKEEEG
ncbi:Ger(x)C family spore germination protein [Paenibacillus sp. ATY16]|uniref:Ger(x)C family spore germination protein n=1 Tax=Paenibacillus sp. ATY16 TaxID=1759312 RepID=UPI00200D8145|nr:Ger(x)C family spore germination protein [Paenibacillus sp. ATY16]